MGPNYNVRAASLAVILYQKIFAFATYIFKGVVLLRQLVRGDYGVPLRSGSRCAGGNAAKTTLKSRLAWSLNGRQLEAF